MISPLNPDSNSIEQNSGITSGMDNQDGARFHPSAKLQIRVSRR